MHLAIDLRFYRPEPYGLAVHIRELFVELIPLLQSQTKFDKITFIFDQANSQVSLAKSLSWWKDLQGEKFRTHFTKVKYYSLAEQTVFLQELNALQADLVFFFTFNFPILYNKPFVYQVLDLNPVKNWPKWHPKLQAMLFCLRVGLGKAKQIVFLGTQTPQEAEKYTQFSFTDETKNNYKPSSIVFNGVGSKYLKTPSANRQKAEIVHLNYSSAQEKKLELLKKKLGLQKPYLIFVSVWKKHKNLSRLVEAFEKFQSQNARKYQLLLVGNIDQKNLEIVDKIHQSDEYLVGNIVVAHTLSDEDIICLQDGAKACIMPSLSEGFGLALVEAAVRGTTVLCSNLPIFQEIMQDGAIFFDPEKVEGIVESMQKLDQISKIENLDLIQKSYQSTTRFRWQNTAQKLLEVFLNSDLTPSSVPENPKLAKTPKLITKQDKKIAILHAFFKWDCKGGAERLIFQIRNYFKADLYTGGISSEVWGRQNKEKDSFAGELWQDGYSFQALHEESKIPIWYLIKRQLHFLFNPKINQLKKYDILIYSGNVGFVPRRLQKSSVKQVLYCNTPPRSFTDQLEKKLLDKPAWQRPIFRLFASFVGSQYKKDYEKMDLIISNSENIRQRLKKFIGLDSIVIPPPVDTTNFKYISQGDYYLSYARLENIKRIPLILEAFSQMPEKRLIIASTGPLKNWLIEQIKIRKLDNIVYEGIVSNQRLHELVGKCLAGIYIPEDEDAGITQCEIMSAGKPVIGVNEGGLKETVIDGKTGVLIPANPSVEDLILAVQKMTPEVATNMRKDCIKQAKKYDSAVFFEKIDKAIRGIA